VFSASISLFLGPKSSIYFAQIAHFASVNVIGSGLISIPPIPPSTAATAFDAEPGRGAPPVRHLQLNLGLAGSPEGERNNGAVRRRRRH